MLNLVPRYILVSKLAHHLSLYAHNLWRIPFVRNRIDKSVGKIEVAIFSKKITSLTGDITQSLFWDKRENGIVFSSADRAIHREFDILGSDSIVLNPMKWNLDLKTRFDWKNRIFYTNQRKQSRCNNSDIKQPWELSRCHHLLWLSEAFLLSGKDEYANAVKDGIEDWIDQNPFLYSVNWTCSMEVAIRAVNWLYSLSMIKTSPCITDEFVTKVYKSLYQHGFFIYNNLEKSFPYSNNHYAADIVGLLFLGLFFKEETKGEWYDYALSEYCLEVRNQVLPSGIHYEKSVSYHRLMTELFGYSYYLLKRNNEVIPDDIAYRIKTMFEYVANYTKSNGMAPLLEDNDNGRLLPFVERDFREHKYLSSDSLEIRIAANGLPLLYEGHKQETRLYEDAGIAILHTADAYLAVTCSGRDKYSEHIKRKKVGCHMHNDLMSFDFAVDENDVFIDPGSYIYTSDIEMRNEFRSTRKHNSVVIDGEEQNVLMQDNAFEVERNSRVDCFSLSANANETICKGSYELIQSGASHERALLLGDNLLCINDTIAKGGKAHMAKFYYHCAEGLQPNTDGRTVNWELNFIHFIMSFNSFNEIQIEIVDDTVSPSYGVLRPSKTIVVTVPFNEKTIITTNIEWTRSIK